mmetsp:Transcript_24334/g.55494  ORF Transcript_24334/g.55494 Transcript_24334/m.55494 type:complete len:394 (+) Transcript_24334:148-1329(+)
MPPGVGPFLLRIRHGCRPIVPPSLLGPLGAERQVDPRRGVEPEGLRHRRQIQLVHVEDVPMRMARVGQKVAPIRVAGGLVQVIILVHQPLELALHVGHLAGRKLVLVEAHLEVGEVSEEAGFLGGEEHEGAAGSGGSAGGPSDPVDVLAGIVGGVELHDPVDVGYVEPAGGDVGAAEGAGLFFAEGEEGGGAFLLFLASVYVHDGHVDVVEELGVVFDGVAAAEEDHDFFLSVFFEEGEEEEEASVGGHRHVSLLQSVDGGRFRGSLGLHVDAGFGVYGETGQVLHLFGLRGAEEHGLSLLGQQFEYVMHVLLEAHLQDSIGLVHDEHLQVVELEPLGVLQVVEQTSRRGHQHVDPPREAFGLRPTVGSSDDEAVGEGVPPRRDEVAQDAVDL